MQLHTDKAEFRSTSVHKAAKIRNIKTPWFIREVNHSAGAARRVTLVVQEYISFPDPEDFILARGSTFLISKARFRWWLASSALFQGAALTLHHRPTGSLYTPTIKYRDLGEAFYKTPSGPFQRNKSVHNYNKQVVYIAQIVAELSWWEAQNQRFGYCCVTYKHGLLIFWGFCSTLLCGWFRKTNFGDS